MSKTSKYETDERQTQILVGEPERKGRLKGTC